MHIQLYANLVSANQKSQYGLNFFVILRIFLLRKKKIVAEISEMVEDGGDRHSSNTLPLFYLTVLTLPLLYITVLILYNSSHSERLCSDCAVLHRSAQSVYPSLGTSITIPSRFKSSNILLQRYSHILKLITITNAASNTPAMNPYAYVYVSLFILISLVQVLYLINTVL